MSGTFTGIREMSEKILFHASLESLESMCGVDKYMRDVCRSESFWRRKLTADIPGVVAFKPDDVSWRDEYEYLMNVTMDAAITSSRTDGIFYRMSHGDHVDVYRLLETAFTDTVFDVLNAGIPVDDGDLYRLAARFGRLEVIHHIGAFPTTQDANAAARGGHVDILLFFEAWDVFPDEDGATDAVANGHVDAVQWLFGQEIQPDSEGIMLAMNRGHLDVLRLVDFQLFVNIPIDAAAVGGQLETLQWGIESQYSFTQNGAIGAVINGHQDVVEWLDEEGIVDTEALVPIAVKHGRLGILEYIDATPASADLDVAARKGYLDVLEWAFDEKRVLPTEDGMADAIKNGYLDTVEWMVDHDVPVHAYMWPDADKNVLDWGIAHGMDMNHTLVANVAASRGKRNVLDMLLHNYGITPDERGATLAAEEGHTNVLDWMLATSGVSSIDHALRHVPDWSFKTLGIVI